MPDPIFARPRHEYQSYSDFWRLVELSDFPIIFMDEIDPASDNTYVFSTPDNHWHDGTYHCGWPGARARIIYYSLEWYLDVDYKGVSGLYDVWSPDSWYATQVGARYAPMGSHPGLNPDGEDDSEKHYDVATLFAPSFRRYSACAALSGSGLTIAPQGWGPERHDILRESRCMVQVHQHDNLATVAPQRWCLAAAYRLPMITETLADPGLFTANHRLMCDLGHLGQFVSTWLSPENRNLLADFGHSLNRLLCEHHTFRYGIEAAL